MIEHTTYYKSNYNWVHNSLKRFKVSSTDYLTSIRTQFVIQSDLLFKNYLLKLLCIQQSFAAINARRPISFCKPKLEKGKKERKKIWLNSLQFWGSSFSSFFFLSISLYLNKNYCWKINVVTLSYLELGLNVYIRKKSIEWGKAEKEFVAISIWKPTNHIYLT